MVFTYDPTRLDIPRNQLRLKLGADGMDPNVFQDEELDFFLEEAKGNIFWALYSCYMTCAMKYSQGIGDSMKIGDVTITEGKTKAQYYLTLAKQLKEDLQNGDIPSGVDSTYVFVGGVYTGESLQTDILQAEGIYDRSFTNELKYNTQKTYSKYPLRFLRGTNYENINNDNFLNEDVVDE